MINYLSTDAGLVRPAVSSSILKIRKHSQHCLVFLGRVGCFLVFEETLTVHLRGEDVHVKPNYEVNQPP